VGCLLPTAAKLSRLEAVYRTFFSGGGAAGCLLREDNFCGTCATLTSDVRLARLQAKGLHKKELRPQQGAHRLHARQATPDTFPAQKERAPLLPAHATLGFTAAAQALARRSLRVSPLFSRGSSATLQAIQSTQPSATHHFASRGMASCPPAMFGDTLVGKDGEVVNTVDALKDKVVGVYFSAHWYAQSSVFFFVRPVFGLKRFPSTSSSFHSDALPVAAPRLMRPPPAGVRPAVGSRPSWRKSTRISR
jgi:hypothetical protein